MTISGRIRCVAKNGKETYCTEEKVKDKAYMKGFGLKVDDPDYEAMIEKSKGKSDVKVETKKSNKSNK